MKHHKDIFIILILIICSGNVVFCQNLSVAIQYEEAYSLEEVQGDIDKAMVIYKEILSQDIDDNLKSICLLRMAFCLEKKGLDEEAQKYYLEIKKSFFHLRPIWQIAEHHLSIRTQDDLEKLRKELAAANKIRNKTPEISKENNEKNEKNEKKLISSTLYSMALESYDDNKLLYAKETLTKSLAFNWQNKDAIELLQEIERKLIAAQDQLFTRTDSEYKWLKGLEKKIIKEDKENFKDILYDFSEILGENSKLNDYTLKNNFILLLKNELPISTTMLSSSMNFIDGNLLVRHNDVFHQEIEKLLQFLAKKKYIYYASVVVASGNGLILQKEIKNLKLNFLSANDGCFYSEVKKENLKKLISQCYEQGVYLHFFPEIVFLKRKIASLEKTFKVPLVKEYINKKVDFNLYEEGLRFLFKVNYENSQINTQISIKKIERPVEQIPLISGPLQVPFIMEQNSSFFAEIEDQKSIIVLGMLNPTSPHYLTSRRSRMENHRIIAFFSFRKIPIKKFLLQSDVEIDIFSKENNDHYPHYYPIATWQKISNISISHSLRLQNKESRNKFMLRLCNNYIKEKTSKTIFRIVADRLLVYGPENTHKKIQYLLNGLRDNKDKLQRFSSYVFYINSDKKDALLLKYWVSTSSKNDLNIYISKRKQEELINELKKNGKLIRKFSPIICNNTQSIEVANFDIKTFWEGIHIKSGSIPAMKVRNVPEGASIQLTSIFINKSEQFIEAQCNIYQRNTKETKYDVNDYSFSIETSQTKTQRGFLRLEHQKDQKYLITGFKDKNYVFLLIPNQIKQE